MKPIFVIIILFVLFLLVVFLIEIFRRKGSEKKSATNDSDSEKTNSSQISSESECCGQHAVCERDARLLSATQAIEYYDDEELDVFQGISSDVYSDLQIEAFEEILHTMQAKDIPGWLRSLQLRSIQLPDNLKDEVMMLMEDVK